MKYNFKNVTVEDIRKAQAGDKASRDAACMGMFKLVSKVAHRIARAYGMDPADLTSEGMIGALEGIDKFDPDRGVKPTTFLVWHVKKRIMLFARTKRDLIRGPQSGEAQKVHYRARRTRAKIMAEKGECDDVDLAKALGVSVATVATVGRVSQPVASLQAGTPGEAGTLGDTLADDKPSPEESAASAQRRAWVMEGLRAFRAELNERDRYIFDARIARSEPIPGREVGAALDMTRQGVSVHEIKIRAKLEKRMKNILK